MFFVATLSMILVLDTSSCAFDTGKNAALGVCHAKISLLFVLLNYIPFWISHLYKIRKKNMTLF